MIIFDGAKEQAEVLVETLKLQTEDHFTLTLNKAPSGNYYVLMLDKYQNSQPKREIIKLGAMLFVEGFKTGLAFTQLKERYDGIRRTAKQVPGTSR